MNLKPLCCWFAFMLIVSVSSLVHGQQVDTLPILKDSAIESSGKKGIDSTRLSNKIDSARKIQKRNDTSIVKQLNLMELYANRLSDMASFFSRGFDTANIIESLGIVEDQIRLAKEGVGIGLQNPNMRNLVATGVLLAEVEKDLDQWRKEVSLYNKQLVEIRIQLDSMSRDTTMRIIPRDSALAQQYVNRILDLVRRFAPIDSMTTTATIEVGLLQGRIVRNLLDVKDQRNVIEIQTRNIRRHFLRRDAQAIWKTDQNKSINNVFGTSFQKAKLVLKYYLKNALNVSAVSLIVFLLLWFVIRLMINRLQLAQKDFMLDNFAPHIKTSVLFSSLFVAVAIAQLLYSNIPMVFLQILWILMWVSVTVLFWPDLNIIWKQIWLAFGVLFLWAILENLLLGSNIVERWIMLLASILGILLCIHMLSVYKKGTDRIKYFYFFTSLFLIQESVAAIANIAGLYTLGRAMAVGGYFNFVLGIIFFYGITVVKELIVLSYEYYNRNDSLKSVVNLYEIKLNAEKILPIVAWSGWCIVFAKNLNFYDVVLTASKTFLNADRKLGNIDFSFGSVAIFFITIWISTLIAKLVTFLLGGNKSQVSTIQKTRFGSSILVLKLAIISLGLLIAFAASGIPLDKITIIIGALGVGIGFGLQTIVNNLVSGVILAFEKPIEIGDQIEVGGRLGKVKEIGIRSSKLATFDGAEVIIPNGDLLSQHVVNWTLSNNHRRVEIIVGVKYGSNLKEAQSILNDALMANELVDKHPTPLVLVHQFNNSSIDFRLLFWTDIGQWVEMKSDIMLAIDSAFRNAGIEIPFPQQDVYIKQMPAETKMETSVTREKTMLDKDQESKKIQD